LYVDVLPPSKALHQRYQCMGTCLCCCTS
jgi:hypothetical protein